MSNGTIWEIVKRAQELKAKTDADPSGGRHTDGTALFAALHEVSADLALVIRDGDCDPFHNPKNIDRFLRFLCKSFGEV